MAQVASGVAQHVELLLGLCTDAWKSLPEVEATIDSWDQLDQIVFIEEWPLEEQRLARLMEYCAEGTMSSEQQTRHDELKRIVEQNRPIIRRLQQT